jgi:DNA repair protein RadD
MYQLRDYQQDAVDQTFRMLTNATIPEAKPVICLPTGAGKSLVIAELARVAVSDFKGRVLVLQHRKELIEQNAEKIQGLLPGYNVGLYSSSLRRRDYLNNIVVAGIHSVYKKASELGGRNLIVIDESHMVPDEDNGIYNSLLSEMESQCRCRTVGLTATPYRTGGGYIYGKDKQFSHLIEPKDADIPTLIERGLLCKLISSNAESSVDTSGLHIRAGEFVSKECERLFGEQEILDACNELLAKTQDRHSVLIFSTSVNHATAIRHILQMSTGSIVEMIHGGTAKLERESIIERFRQLRTRYLVNVDVLTTGFDAPVVDCVAILRATASPGLYAQIVGRGMRPHESKQDCLILDFGENIKRHGPIDRIRPSRKTSSETNGEAVETEQSVSGRMCPACEVIARPDQIECECGFRFPIGFRHNATTDETEIISKDTERFYEVDKVLYRVVNPKGQSAKLMVQYVVTSSGKTRLPDDLPTRFVSFDSTNEQTDDYCRKWWGRRSSEPFPGNAFDAAKIAKNGGLAKPVSIIATKEKSSWTITYGPIRKEVANETVS